MTYARITAILGFLTLLISYSGLPGSWKTLFNTIFGIAIMYCGYRLYKMLEIKKLEGEQQTKTYAETSSQSNVVENTPASNIPSI